MVKDTAFTLVSRGLTLIFALLIAVIVTRSLGPTLKGSYEISILIVRTSFILSVFGLDAATVFLGAREPQKLPIFVGNSIVAALVLGLIVILLLEGLLSVEVVQEYLLKNGTSVEWMRWLIGLVPFMLLHLYLQEVIRGAGQILVYSSISITQFAINLILLAGILFFPQNRLEVALLSWVIAQILITVLTLFLALRATHFQISFDFQTFQQSFLFGIQLHPGNIAQFLNYRLDIFLIGIFLTPEAVAFYATATLLAERLWDIPTAIRTSLTYHVSSRPSEAAALTARTCRMIVIVMTPIHLSLLLFARPMIQVMFGAEFLPTIEPLILLLPGIWTLSLGKILVTYLSSAGRPIVGTWSAFISLISTVLIDLFLIPRIGIAGAAITSSVSYTIATIVIGYIFIQDTKIPLSQLIIPQKEDWRSVQQLGIRFRERLNLKSSS